jgi:RHS repeat-associated protein
VTHDARQVVPAPATRIYEFTGAMINSGNSPAAAGPTPGNPRVGEPVDPSTGLFVMQKTDLYLPDVIPLSLTRIYNSGDDLIRPFGRGMTHPYAMFLWSAHEYTEADLVLPDGGKIHYVRTTTGTGIPGVVLSHQESASSSATPTAFYKSTIVWNGRGWDLRLLDGTMYIFGENAPLQSIRDRYGNVVTIAHEFGQVGKITRVTSPNGRWIAFLYDSLGRIARTSDNIGRSVAYTYDSVGNLATVTDAEQGVTKYTYSSSNQLATITDPRNIVFLTNTYQGGRIASQTLADGAATFRFAYTLDAGGAITQTDVTDPRGHIERLVFNADHYTVSDTRAAGLPDQRTVTIGRRPGANLVTSLVDALGRRTELEYDGSGKVIRTTQLAGTSEARSVTTTYEPQYLQPASITDPGGHTWTATYDLSGLLTGITDPLGRRTAIRMNAAGRVTTVTDALARSWRFAYSGGDLSTVTDPANGAFSAFFDAAGRMIGATNPLGQASQFTWDRLNQLTSATDALGGRTLLARDGNGNLLTLTDALSHATRVAYDVFDRARERVDQLSRSETREYDGNGNLTRVVDRKGQATTYAYDALDRLVRVAFDDGSTVTYTYDAADRITRIDDSANGSIVREYDAFDRITQESTPVSTISYSYDGDGQRTSMSVTGQASVAYTYDAGHQLTSIVQGTAEVDLAYDAVGRRSSVSFPDGIVATYSYDAVDQVVGLSYAHDGVVLGELSYAYDAAGNPTSVGGSWARTVLPSSVASATYDEANRLLSWGSATVLHDANGNLVWDGRNRYVWNARNLLASLSGPVPAVFQYDAMARRRAKAIAGQTTWFVYDGPNAVQELASNGQPSANMLTGLGIDETYMRTDSGSRVLLPDALGSTMALADASGAVRTEYAYAPFGETTTSGASGTNPTQFTGRENDGTGLYYYRARYYLPSFGRFIGEDPLGQASGPNMYSYVGNSPTAGTDPTGLFRCKWHQQLTTAAAIAAGLGDWVQFLSDHVCDPDHRPRAASNEPYRTHEHGMAGRKGKHVYESCDTAYRGSQRLLQRLMEEERLSDALHLLQDQWADGHRFQPWDSYWRYPAGTGPVTHFMGDVFPSREAIGGAYEASLRFLFDYKNGDWLDPTEYLYDFCQ